MVSFGFARRLIPPYRCVVETVEMVHPFDLPRPFGRAAIRSTSLLKVAKRRFGDKSSVMPGAGFHTLHPMIAAVR